ncbi:hypothetical protein Golob_011667 [Gossypium lobatum]|uniref:RNase H type-1 domain-containing protein n=1 Tax=Gossypium lobatum TaxID=34289 RepID=A0A7J8MQM4_9ROSI|nr:hypothetical protein [Gossypium lobatum]
MAKQEGLKALKNNESICKSYGVQEDIPRVRILFDATYDNKTFRSAFGLVGWDLRGNLTVLKTIIHSNDPSPFAAEAYA